MASIDLKLPSDLVLAAKLDESNLSQDAAMIIALQLFREGTVSIGRAAELCSTPLAAFMEYAASHGVSPLNYDLDALEEDRRTISKLRM
jgi:predicted HTH domain antitoxin